MTATKKELRTAFLAGWAARNKRPFVQPMTAFTEWDTGAYNVVIKQASPLHRENVKREIRKRFDAAVEVKAAELLADVDEPCTHVYNKFGVCIWCSHQLPREQRTRGV